MLDGQKAELLKSMNVTISQLKQELQDKTNIIETLQQQIRMKMFMNMTAALADMQTGMQQYAADYTRYS